MAKRKTTTKKSPRWIEWAEMIDGKIYHRGTECESMRGMRLTDCCGSVSTFNEYGELYCKHCYYPVPFGQGDGSEYDPKRFTPNDDPNEMTD